MKLWSRLYVITVLAHVQLSEATGLSKPDGITIDTDVTENDTHFSDLVAQRILRANLWDPACKRCVSDIDKGLFKKDASGQTDNRVIRWIQDKLETSDSDTTISQLDLADEDWILEHISHVVEFDNSDKLVVVITGWMDGHYSVNYTTRTRAFKGAVRSKLGKWESAKLNQKHDKEKKKEDGHFQRSVYSMDTRDPLTKERIFEGSLRHMVKIVNEEGETVGLVAVLVSAWNDRRWFKGRSKKFDLYSPRFVPALTFVPTQNFSVATSKIVMNGKAIDKLLAFPAITVVHTTNIKSKRNLPYAQTRNGYTSSSKSVINGSLNVANKSKSVNDAMPLTLVQA